VVEIFLYPQALWLASLAEKHFTWRGLAASELFITA